MGKARQSDKQAKDIDMHLVKNVLKSVREASHDPQAAAEKKLAPAPLPVPAPPPPPSSLPPPQPDKENTALGQDHSFECSSSSSEPEINFGEKFMWRGKTLNLPGVGQKDSIHQRIEAMRMFLEKELGEDVFIHVYNIMNAIAPGDDEFELEKQLQDYVGTDHMEHLCLIAQLIFCEEQANEQRVGKE